MESFDVVEVALSLMREALDLLDGPESTSAAMFLRLAIEAAAKLADGPRSEGESG